MVVVTPPSVDPATVPAEEAVAAAVAAAAVAVATAPTSPLPATNSRPVSTSASPTAAAATTIHRSNSTPDLPASLLLDTPFLPRAGVKRPARQMDPATPTSPSQDALLILRSIDNLRADFSGQLAEMRADTIGLQDRVSFTEAQLESLEDRLITTDQRAITVQEQLRTHVNDCTSPAIDITILERLCAVESSQQELRAENKQIRMENQQLRALLTAREHTSPSRDSASSQPSTSSSDPALLARVQFLTNELVTIRKELREEERKRDNLEANSRLYNLEIAGLPVVNPGSDNPLALARKLVTEVTGGRVQESAVDVAHRKAGGPKNIILRFRTRTDRDKVYAAKKRLMTMS